MHQEIIDYIQQAQKHGLAEIEIKQNLLNAGWEAETVEQSVVFARASEHNSLQPRPEVLTDKSPSSTLMQYSQPKNSAGQNLGPNFVSQPAVSFNDVTSPASRSGKNRLTKIVIAGFVFVLALTGSGTFVYFKYFSNTAASVWKKFSGSTSDHIYKSDFELGYSFKYADKSSVEAKPKPIKAILTGTLYTNSTDVNNYQLNEHLKGSFQNDADSFSTGFDLLFLDKILYINISKIDQLKSIIGEQTAPWIKINFSELEKYANEKTGKSGSFESAQKNDLNDFEDLKRLALENVIKPGNFFAKESQNGVAVFHLKNEIDKQALNAKILASIEKVLSQPQFSDKALTNDQKDFIATIVNKIEIKEFDTWIGQNDFQLYKIHFVISLPSVADLASTDILQSSPMGDSQAQRRDAIRLNDTKRISAALSMFFAANKGYPEGLNGIPQNLSPNFLAAYPSSPVPADGTCTDYYNTYWYSPEGKPKIVNGQNIYPSYILTFCLGTNTGINKAGIAQLSPQELKTAVVCPSSPENCVNLTSKVVPDIFTEIKSLPFNAELNFDSSYSELGKQQVLTVPADSVDIIEILNKFFGGKVQNTQASSTPISQKSM